MDIVSIPTRLNELWADLRSYRAPWRRPAPGWWALAALVVLAVAGAPLGAQHPLVSLPLDDPAYVQLGALADRGCAAARVSPYRPFAVGAVRAALARAEAEARCGGPVLEALRERFGADSAAARDTVATREGLRLGGAVTVRATALDGGEFRPLFDTVRAAGAGDPPVVGLLRARVTWSGGERVIAVIEGYAQTHRRNDPLVRGRAFRNTSGVVDYGEAQLVGRLGPLTLAFGRAAEAWLGEGRESLALSGQHPPLDRLLIAGRWRTLEARAIVATLNDVVLDQDRDSLAAGTPRRQFHRMLIGHALTWTPTPRLELTLGETGVLARGATVLDLAYANPLMLYKVTDNDSSRLGTDQRDNLTAFGAVRVLAGPVTLRGELLVDDIQIDRADRERIPDQLAWQLRATAPLPLLSALVGVEYRRVDSYTYLRRPYTEVYQHHDRPLGSELGPDADLLRGHAELWLGGRTRLAGAVGAWRRGALRLSDRPGHRASGHAGEPFPSGQAVQRALLGELTAQSLSPRLPLTLRFEGARISNANNRLAPAALYVRAQLLGTYAFRYP